MNPVENDELRQVTWYLEHRVEYLKNKQKTLKASIEAADPFDYDLLREFMENKGRIKEIGQLIDHLAKW